MNETEAFSANAPSAGGQLRAARETSGISLEDVAARTRIPQRHLEAIERDDFNALPSPEQVMAHVNGSPVRSTTSVGSTTIEIDSKGLK